MINGTLIKERLSEARGIAWDECHKIYVLMDEGQVELMRKYEYDPLITKDEQSADKMFDTVELWFDSSCPLRFISATYSGGVADIPAADRFEDLIAQGEEESYDDEEYE